MQIAITAGHSGTDPGAVNTSLKLTEAGLATNLRDQVAALLRLRGFTVVEDGADGENQPLKQALTLVKNRLAIELHFNAGPPTAKGVEAISLPKLRAFSCKLAQSVARTLKTKVRGMEGWIDQSQSQHPRLAFVQAGGVILEVCFISNNQEMIFYTANSSLVARSIVEVITDYMDEVEP